MESLIIRRTDHTAESLMDAINRHRLRAGKAWWTVSGPFYGHHLEIKAHGSWAQIFRVDGIDHSFGHTDTVRAWRTNTLRILTKLESSMTTLTPE
jgi:hypothetical protein